LVARADAQSQHGVAREPFAHQNNSSSYLPHGHRQTQAAYDAAVVIICRAFLWTGSLPHHPTLCWRTCCAPPRAALCQDRCFLGCRALLTSVVRWTFLRHASQTFPLQTPSGCVTSPLNNSSTSPPRVLLAYFLHKHLPPVQNPPSIACRIWSPHAAAHTLPILLPSMGMPTNASDIYMDVAIVHFLPVQPGYHYDPSYSTSCLLMDMPAAAGHG